MDFFLMDSNEKIILSDKVFNEKLNIPLIHQVITSYMNNKRKGNSTQKSRSDVSGSNRKPWSQKGIGKARAGSTKSPIWRKGGVTFASKPIKYYFKVNRKMYLFAYRSILSDIVRKSKLYIFNNFDIKYPKTKSFLKKIFFLDSVNVLIITLNISNNLYLSSRNLHNVFVCNVKNISLLNLISFKNIISTFEAIKYLEDKLYD